MRKLIIPLLLVSTAVTPAFAQDRDGRRDRGGQSAQSDDSDRAARRAARAERAEARRADRPQRAERADRPQRAETVSEQPAVAAETPRRVRVVRPADNGVRRVETRRDGGDNDSLARRLIEMRNARRDGTVEVLRDRDGERNYGDRRDGDRNWSRDRDGNREVRNYSDSDRRWSSHWRSDRRYDWRRYRDHNRSIFRFGSYYDPYRYGYRRFSIGFNLWPSYYSSRYWLNDPWQYRLPPAYGPYRWVRYYDDALLVNIYTGEVVDVINSFFW